MHQIKCLTVVFVLIAVLFNPLFAKSASKPALMLANVYHQGIDLEQYWVSEKYDGVRALWDGEKLVSRGGNTYHAPQWFIQGFPKQTLDGELWLGRQQFERLLSTVKDHEPDHNAWRQVRYMVFDMPELSLTFTERITHINQVVEKADIDWLQAVEQWKVSDHHTLMQQLAKITGTGAEGLMLHRGSSFYQGKRNGDLLKVKSYEDAEAVVIAHIPGKGKYENKMGALLVETVLVETLNNAGMVTDLANSRKVRFKLGTGFSDKERSNPPKIGDIVTFQFRGKTKNGIPRFASYLRVRKSTNKKEAIK